MDFRIFPTLVGKRSACINLDACARYHWNTNLGVPAPAISPFAVDPFVCDDLVTANHKERGLVWSWGGYLENRSTLWAGTYLDETGNYLHLGIDFNVPAGTPVAAPAPCKVVLIDDDTPEQHGWGNRLVARDTKTGLYVIYAHLAPRVGCRVGEELAAGQVFARVGGPSNNGFWFPHLHLQAVAPDVWSYHTQSHKHLKRLDGYGHPREREMLIRRYPNPVVALGL